MKLFTNFCLLLGVLAIASADPSSNRWQSHGNSLTDNLKPTEWLTVRELESLPSMEELTSENLEKISVQEGADLLRKMYHISQAGQAFEPKFKPKFSEIPCYLITPENKKITFYLSELPKMARDETYFGNQEVTFFITGLPQTTETVRKAFKKLVQAYTQRYNGQAPQTVNIKYEHDSIGKGNPSSSEENEESWKKYSGNFVVIELGNLLHPMLNYVTFDMEKTGTEIGDILVEIIDSSNLSQEIVHIIGANSGAHVAGAAGRQYTRQTGHKLRRITGLDPSNIYAQNVKSLRGLSRGDADFVDVIHTSDYGWTSPVRRGDVDFYPSGTREGVPGVHNVVEATMRAIYYFAETVVPGNEHNFPAVAATSLDQYKHQNGYGKRVYMGIATDYDTKGDYMLQVNSKSPFGHRTPAHKQQNYHNIHKPWKSSHL